MFANVTPQSVDDGTFHALLPADNLSDGALITAYTSAYKEVDQKASDFIAKKVLPKPEYEADGKPKGAFGTLLSVQAEWKKSSLSNNKKAVGDAKADEQKEVSGYLGLKIKNIELEIEDLQNLLPATKAFLPDALDEKGMLIADNDLRKDPGESKVLHVVYVFC